MITICYWCQRFGNQLFQYAFGKSLSLRSGIAVIFPATFFSDVPHRIPYRELWQPQNLPGTILPGVPIGVRQSMRGVFDLRLLDSKRPLIVTGYFENYGAYIQPFKEEIRLMLSLPPLDDRVHPDDLYVHMRRTDFALAYAPLRGQSGMPAWTPLPVLEAAIGSFRFRRLVIITDDVSDIEVIRVRDRFHAVIDSDTMTGHFLKLAAARQVVMSTSTFSWWATFLGRGERIVCPLWRGCSWERGRREDGFPKLEIWDENRFEYPAFELLPNMP